MTADSSGNVIHIKSFSNDRLSQDFLFPRMNIKEEIKTDTLTVEQTSSTNRNPNILTHIENNAKENEQEKLKKKDIKRKGGILSNNQNIKQTNGVMILENKLEEES